MSQGWANRLRASSEAARRRWGLGNVFTGEYERSLDNKGRLMLPPVWRSELAAGGYLALEQATGCLTLITEETMRDTAQRLLEGVREGRYTEAQQRGWAASLTPVQLDGQGRIALPQPLRERAMIAGGVNLVGNLNRAEIWNPERYDNWKDVNAADADGAVFY